MYGLRLQALAACLLGAVCMISPASAQWSPAPGVAARDVALAYDDGAVWIVGNEPVPGGYRVYRSYLGTLPDSPWQAAPGGAVRIAVQDTTPWIINDEGKVSRLAGRIGDPSRPAQWESIPAPKAVDIGANVLPTSVWITAEPKRGDDYTVYRWTGKDWAQANFAATRIDVDDLGNPWVVTAAGAVWAFFNNQWQQFASPAPAADLAVSSFGEPWIVAKDSTLQRYVATSKRWESAGNGGSAIATRKNRTWQASTRQELLTYGLLAIGTSTALSSMTTSRPSGSSLNISLDPNKATLDESGTGSGQANIDIKVQGCIADPKKCVSFTPIEDPYPNLHGSVRCPLVNPGPPAMLRLKCEEIGSAAIKLSGKPSSGKCSVRAPAGYGQAFADPRNGGECWACPIGFMRTWAAVNTPVGASPAACRAAFVWNAPQYPEPGLYSFLFDGNRSVVLDHMFKNPAALRRLIQRRAKGDANVERQLWTNLIRSPGDSPELKAMALVTMLRLLRDGKNDVSIERFRQYIEKRRRFVVEEGLQIYAAWKQFDAFLQSDAIRGAVGGGGGLPGEDSGSLNADILGTPPIDFLGYAWGAAVPDTAGQAYLKALAALYKMKASGELNVERPGAEADFDVLGALEMVMDASEPVTAVLDELDKLPDSVSVGLFVVQRGLEIFNAIMTLVAQAEAEKQAAEAQRFAQSDVNLRAMAKDPKQVSQILLYWALATTPYQGSKAYGTGRITQCLPEWKSWCDATKTRLVATARAAGVDEKLIADAAGSVAPPPVGWVPHKAGITGSVVAGYKDGKALTVCRASMGDGVHPGKVWNNGCHVGWGGKEITKTEFEVLVVAEQGKLQWRAFAAGGAAPRNALVAGKRGGDNLYVCRAAMRDGVHPGKLYQGRCHVGWGGKEEIATSKIDILLELR